MIVLITRLMMEKLCRICLGNEANIPIFEINEDGTNINSKLSLCVREKVEDIEGYPRNICKTCNSTLDSVSLFIQKYKESYRILESGLVPLKEEKYHFIDSCNEHSEEVEIEFEEVKSEDDEVLKSENSAEPVALKLERLKQLSIKKVCLKSKPIKNETSSIAESVLEGSFKWNGERWCIKKKNKSLPQKIILKTKKNKSVILKEVKNIIKKKEVNDKPVTKPNNEPNPPKLCDLCGDVFSTADQLGYHKKKMHESQPAQCATCGRTCSSTYYLNRHMKRKHSDEKNFVCTICGKRFAFKGELTSHYKAVHVKKTGPPKTWSCKICGKTYKCRKSVVVHERAVHTGERPAVCKICNTSFTHEDYLRDHMRLHTGETPFKCPICGRGYAQRCNMKSHLRIHRVSELSAVALSELRPNYLRRLKV